MLKGWFFGMIFAPWILCAAPQQDKVQHFAVSGVLGALADQVVTYKTHLSKGPRIALATGLAMVPGVVKEAIDAQEVGNHFSKKDLAYDLAGALAGVLLSELYTSQVQLKVKKNEAALSWQAPF